MKAVAQSLVNDDGAGQGTLTSVIWTVQINKIRTSNTNSKY